MVSLKSLHMCPQYASYTCICVYETKVQRNMLSHPCLSFSSLSLMISISFSLASRAVEKPDDHRGTFTFTGAEIRPAGGRGEGVQQTYKDGQKPPQSNVY